MNKLLSSSATLALLLATNSYAQNTTTAGGAVYGPGNVSSPDDFKTMYDANIASAKAARAAAAPSKDSGRGGSRAPPGAAHSPQCKATGARASASGPPC